MQLFPVLLQNEHGDFSTWIIKPTDAESNRKENIAALVDKKEFTSDTFWEEMLSIFHFDKMELARYSLANPDLDPAIFLKCFDIRPTYRSLDEWRESAMFDDRTAQLYRCYDFPVSLLRLWNRWSDEFRDSWSTLFQKHNVKKNIVREIISDLYDLNDADKKEALQKAETLSLSFEKSRSPFPSDTLRDMVRMLREPHIQSTKLRLQKLKHEAESKGDVTVDYPDDLETPDIKVILNLSSVDEFKTKLNRISAEEFRSILSQIVDTINE